MDDGIDIYEDLPNFNTNEIENCSTNAIEVAGKCDELTKQVNELTEKVKKLEKDNEILEVNISSLLKTAKAEIARKDRMIADLREQLDNTLFRRGGNHVPYSQPRIKRESKPQPAKEQHYIRKPQYVVNHVHTTENEVTSTDIDYSTPIEEEYSEKKAVDAQKKLQDTLYGKRLRKKIMEKEKEEAKEVNMKYKESVGSSVGESNKENAVVNKIGADTDALVCAAESCVVEIKKEHDSYQNVDKKTDHFQASQKYLNTSTTCLPASEVSNKCPIAMHSIEIPVKRSNEDATNFPSSKRKKNNDDHPDIQYGFQLEGSQSSSSSNVTSKSNIESKYIHHETKSHDKYDRKKCDRRYSEEEMFQSHESKSKNVPEGSSAEPYYDNYERKHYSRRDIDDKRDKYRHRNTDHRPTSRSRDRSREKSKEKNNYHEKFRENSSHYDHDKSYQSHNRGSDRKYSHKSYDRHYSSDRRTFKSTSRKEDDFKEKDSSTCKTSHRNGYDLRDKVENRYEKKSDYIYYESNKYKNNRYRTETSTRSRRSLSKIKEEIESSRLCKSSAENIKQELKEINESKPQIKDITLSKVEVKTEDVDALEEGEVMDTPKSTPVKNNTNSFESFTEVIDVEKKDSIETTASEIYQVANITEMKPNDSDNKADLSAREEVIENIEHFIQNYDEQKFSIEIPNTAKQSNIDALKYDNDNIENVENVLAMDDDLNQSEEENDTIKKCKGSVVDREDKSVEHNRVHIAASIDQITENFEAKYQTHKIKSQESAEMAEAIVLDKPSDIFLKHVDDIICKLPSKLQETDKAGASSKNDVTILKVECTDDTSGISTVNVHTELHNNKETSLTGRHTDDDVNETKIERDNLKRSSLYNKEPEETILVEPKKEVVGLLDKVVALECTKVNLFVDSSKVSTTDDVCVTDKNTVNSDRTTLSVVNSAEETKPDNCKDNKQIKGCPNNSAKTNENKGRNNDRSKVIVARRRKPVQLGDMNASMTIVMSQPAVKPSEHVNNVPESSNTLKPRACKVPRSYKKIH